MFIFLPFFCCEFCSVLLLMCTWKVLSMWLDYTYSHIAILADERPCPPYNDHVLVVCFRVQLVAEVFFT